MRYLIKLHKNSKLYKLSNTKKWIAILHKRLKTLPDEYKIGT